MVVQTIRFRFGKRGDMRFLSHLDLSRAMERAFRRASLPVAFTQGFNPHIRFSFPHALALGVESNCELCEVCLVALMDPAEFTRRVTQVLPEEMHPYDTQALPGCVRSRPLQTTYRFSGGALKSVAPGHAQAILERNEIRIARMGKPKKNKSYRRAPRSVGRSVDIRPAIADIQILGDECVEVTLNLQGRVGVRIGEILGLLGVEQNQPGLFIERTSLLLDPCNDKEATEEKEHETCR